LGHLYENSGDLRSAEMHYRIALEERPDYPYALAGLARISTAKKDYGTSINYLLKATSLVNDYSFKEDLADAYRLNGEAGKSDALAKSVVEEMNKDSKSGLTNDNLGHYADRELAYAYLKINEPGKALEHALTEYERRPKNIDVNETVAWVLYNENKPTEAIPYLKEALKTNNKNPTLLCRAGLIFAKAGEKEKGKILLEDGLKNNPNITEDLRSESFNELKKEMNIEN
jgi:tetratricopeptide (TPR) repeat protein